MKRRQRWTQTLEDTVRRQREIYEASLALGAKPISSAPGPGMSLFAIDEPEEHEARREKPPLDLGDNDHDATP